MSTRIEVVVVCTDDESPDTLLACVPDEPVIKTTVLRGVRPCSTPRIVNGAMDSIIAERGRPWLWVIVHPDVELPPAFFGNLRHQIGRLESIDPHYGVVGVMGVRLDAGRKVCVGHLWDRNYEAGAPLEHPCIVDTLDEVCVVLRGDREWKLDEELGTYHLWASELCLAQKFQRRTNYVLPGLYIMHHSTAPHTTPDDGYFYYNLGVLSERYRLEGQTLLTPSGAVIDDGTDAGIRLL